MFAYADEIILVRQPIALTAVAGMLQAIAQPMQVVQLLLLGPGLPVCAFAGRQCIEMHF